MKNLQTKVHALDQEQTRQQELIYSAEFQIQQMERKVARGMGERTDEEKSQLNSKIRELEVRPPELRMHRAVHGAEGILLGVDVEQEVRQCLFLAHIGFGAGEMGCPKGANERADHFLFSVCGSRLE